MIFSKSLPRLRNKASSKDRALASTSVGSSSSSFLNREALEFDLLSQLVHVASLSTSGMSRATLFEQMATLPYSTAAYFRRVHFVAQRLNYDYSRACQVVADSMNVGPVRDLLLRFASSLSSGESEQVFLEREMHVQLEEYSSKYHRDLESLQKWTDAFIALSVSATLIVVVSLVSTMIYSIGSGFILAMAAVVIGVNVLGVWIIFRVAPHEVKTSRLQEKSAEQERAAQLAAILIPLGLVVSAGVAFLAGVGAGVALMGLFMAPPGIMALLEDFKIDDRDRAVSQFLRALGGIVGAANSTLLDGLQRLNRRALGPLAGMVERLQMRLKGGIKSDLCWQRFISESGSELVHRSTRMFFDAMAHGSDAEKVGKFVSDYAMKIALLRANRKLVANTFAMMVVPLHAVLVAIMLFITNVLVVFATELTRIQEESISTSRLQQEAGIGNVLLFAAPNIQFITAFAIAVILVLTITNSLAPYVASGGHPLKVCLFAAGMLLMSGLALMFIPGVVQGLFSSVSKGLESAPAPAGG